MCQITSDYVVGSDFRAEMREGGVAVFNFPHLVKHSPTGMSWGYGGSGPADMARSILGCIDGRLADRPDIYQEFKWRYIAGMDERGGVIPYGVVLEFLEEIGWR